MHPLGERQATRSPKRAVIPAVCPTKGDTCRRCRTGQIGLGSPCPTGELALVRAGERPSPPWSPRVVHGRPDRHEGPWPPTVRGHAPRASHGLAPAHRGWLEEGRTELTGAPPGEPLELERWAPGPLEAEAPLPPRPSARGGSWPRRHRRGSAVALARAARRSRRPSRCRLGTPRRWPCARGWRREPLLRPRPPRTRKVSGSVCFRLELQA